MNTEAIGVPIVVIVVGTLIGAGIGHFALDYRHFDQIKRDCTERGFIQNDKVRINCSVEEQKK